MRTKRTCSRCGDVKECQEFPLWKTGRTSHCRECERGRSRQKAESPAVRFRKIRRRALAQQVPLGFSQEGFVAWYETEPRVCCYCGIEEELLTSWVGKQWRTLTVDRVQPSEGYVPGNIVLACMPCNRAKGDLLTGDQMREIAVRFLHPKVAACRQQARD
jgi:5-methylcytosine-specific restriction endonuclease McrA